MDGRTAAATLGVSAGATREEIRQAFRARVKLVHPDTTSGSPQAFLTLRAAFEFLVADAPAAVEPNGSVNADRGPWSVADTNVRRPTIDLTDRPNLRRPPTVRTVPRAGSAAPVDANGLSFEDHLAAALEERAA